MKKMKKMKKMIKMMKIKKDEGEDEYQVLKAFLRKKKLLKM